MARYSTSRQKACDACSVAKAKCDRKQNGCSRCSQRVLNCTYQSAVSSRKPAQGKEGLRQDGRNGLGLHSPVSIDGQPQTPFDAADSFGPLSVGNEAGENSTRPASLVSQTDESLDFVGLELVCPIDANEISNRWLHAYVPLPGQTVKTYHPRITHYIYRMLQSYTNVVVNRRGVPPFVHALQLQVPSVNLSLLTCLRLARIWDAPEAESDDAVTSIIHREMESLYARHTQLDIASSLSAFQSYLIYIMILFFRQGTNPYLRQAMMNLQDLACFSSQQGLVCTSEQQHIRPSWEAWIVAESKRRTLYIMYLLDSLLSAQDGMPTFIGTELAGLPSTGGKTLWEARNRNAWETAYNVHLAEWPEGGLRIDELWPMPPDFDAPNTARRRSRVDQWLETVDEYGTMLYAITSCTHGG